MSHGAGLLVVAALWGLAPCQHSCADVQQQQGH